MKTQTKRIGMILAALAVILAIWLAWPRDHLLTEAAHAIVQVKPKEDLSWLTDDKLLVITTEQEGDWAGSQSWQGHFDLFDRRTGLRTPLPGLTALFRRSDISRLGAPAGMELSPGNTWLVWRNYRTADGYPFPAAAHLDGTHYREWGSDKQDIGFFLDDRRYVQETGDEAFSLVVHDLRNARKDKSYPRTAPEAKSILAFQSRQQPYALERNDSHSENEDIELDLYRSEDTLPVWVAYRYPNRKPPLPIKKTFVRLPKDAHLLGWDVSPKQDRILFHLQRSRGNPVAALLRRLFPHITIPPNVTEAIWTSRLDGSQMHEIGYVEAPAPAADLHQSQEDSPNDALESVQWTPNGQQIRFVYRGIIFVVSVEGGQP